MWKFNKTGESWPSEGDFIYHLFMNPWIYNEKAKEGIKKYYYQLRMGNRPFEKVKIK